MIDEQQEKNWYGSAHRTLRHFCRWQYEHNHPNDDHPLHYDTAILLTKIDLCSKNDYNPNNEMDRNVNWRRTMAKITRSSCDTLGLAHSGQICDPETSCAIVEDNGLSAAFTIAHELGHLYVEIIIILENNNNGFFIGLVYHMMMRNNVNDSMNKQMMIQIINDQNLMLWCE